MSFKTKLKRIICFFKGHDYAYIGDTSAFKTYKCKRCDCSKFEKIKYVQTKVQFKSLKEAFESVPEDTVSNISILQKSTGKIIVSRNIDVNK